MPHFIPYLLLLIFSILIMVYLLVRTRSYYTIILLLSLSGMIYLFEYVILVLFDAYHYKPMVLSNPFVDSTIGALISNLFIVPTIATTFVLLRLHKLWSIVFALFFTGIEWLFLRLGVFEHNWWRLPYTTVSILILLGIAWLLNKKAVQGNTVIRYIILFMFSFWLIDNLTFNLLLAGVRHYVLGVFEDPARDDSVLHVPYSLLKALLITSAIYWTRKIYWLIGAVILILASTICLIRLNVLQLYVHEWMYLLIYILCCLLCVIVIYWTIRWLKRQSFQ